MALTYKRRMFIDAFLDAEADTFLHGTNAARKAGYAYPRREAVRLLSLAVIKEALQKRLYAAGANEAALLSRWLRTAVVDISPYVNSTGLRVEALKEAGLGWMIKGVRTTQVSTIFELRDPERAAEQIAKHLGMFVERREVDLKRRDIDREIEGELAKLAARGQDTDAGSAEGTE